MKLYLKITLLLVVIINLFVQQQVLAQNEDYINEKLASIGFGKYFNKDPKEEIQEFFANIDKYSDLNNFKKIKSYFSKDFVNNDGFDYSLYLKSMKDSSDTYTNRKSKTKILDIQIMENYATVHVEENGEATTLKDSKDNLGKGTIILKAEIYYTLKKDGRNWKILSANTVKENCMILFGEAKKMYFSLNAPMQVKADTEYTATLSFQPLSDCVYMSSISTEPIIYPVPKTKDVFKAVKPDGVLERIFRANSNNYNEYVIASIGITKPEVVSDAALNIKLVGAAYVLNRVNIFPSSKSKQLTKI